MRIARGFGGMKWAYFFEIVLRLLSRAGAVKSWLL